MTYSIQENHSKLQEYFANLKENYPYLKEAINSASEICDILTFHYKMKSFPIVQPFHPDDERYTILYLTWNVVNLAVHIDIHLDGKVDWFIIDLLIPVKNQPFEENKTVSELPSHLFEFISKIEPYIPE